MLAGDVGCLRGVQPAQPAGQKGLRAGEEGFSILPRKRLCLFCCKVVAGLNWNCLSHELIQLLSNLQVHSMGWRRVGVSSPGREDASSPSHAYRRTGNEPMATCTHLQQKESSLYQPSWFCWVGSFLI